jgi:hypothetical protein
MASVLTRTIVRIDHTKTLWANTWFSVKERLEASEGEYLTYRSTLRSAPKSPLQIVKPR